MENSVTSALHCLKLEYLPSPPIGKTGWPWTEDSKHLSGNMPNGRPWPRISIVTPSYNQGQFIEESIRSVLLQGYPNLEYMIIDGASTDETVEIIKKYEPWLSYWISESDNGQSHAINKGLSRCNGHFFNWHNSDDILVPGSLIAAVSSLVKYPQAGYVHGGCVYIDKESAVQHDTASGYDGEISFKPELEDAVTTLQAGYQPGCLMCRDLVVKAGMVDENMHYIMDVDILLGVALFRPPLYISKPLVYVRIYPEIKSGQWNNQRARERISIVKKIFSRSDLPGSIRSLKRKSFATAHQFAWLGSARAGNYMYFFWHLFMDVFYSIGCGWRNRISGLLRIRDYGKLPRKDQANRLKNLL